MSETIFTEFGKKKIQYTSDDSMPHILRLCYAHNTKTSNIIDTSGDNIKNIDLWRYFSNETEHTKKLSTLLSTHTLDFSGVDFSELKQGKHDKYLSYFLARPNHKDAYRNLKELNNISNTEIIFTRIKNNIFYDNINVGSDDYRKLTNLFYDFPLEFINLLYERNIDNITYKGMVDMMNNTTNNFTAFNNNIIGSRLKSLTSKQEMTTRFNDLRKKQLISYQEQLIQYSPDLKSLISNLDSLSKKNEPLLYYFLWSLMNNTFDKELLKKWHTYKKNITTVDDQEEWVDVDEQEEWVDVGEQEEDEQEEDEQEEDDEDSDKLLQKLEMGGKTINKLQKIDTSLCKTQIADLFIEHFTCKTPYDLGKNQFSEFYKISTELYKRLCVHPGDNNVYNNSLTKLSILDMAFLCDDEMDEILLKILKKKIKQNGGASAASAAPTEAPTVLVKLKSLQQPTANQNMILLTKRFIEYYNNLTTQSNQNDTLYVIYNSMKKYIYCYFINLDFDKLSLSQYIYYITHDVNKNCNHTDDHINETYFNTQISELKNYINGKEDAELNLRHKYDENNEKEKYINKEVFGALKIAWREAMIYMMLNEKLIFNTDIFLKSKLIDALGLRNKSYHRELDNTLLYLICKRAYGSAKLMGVPNKVSFLNNTILLCNVRKSCESFKYQNLLPSLRSSLKYLKNQQPESGGPLQSNYTKPIQGGRNKTRIVKNKYFKTMAKRKRANRRSIKNHKEKSKRHNKPRKNNHSSKQIKINKH